MAKQRNSFLGNLSQDPTSKVYGEDLSVMEKLPALPKLDESQQQEIDSEVARQKEIEAKLEENEKRITEQKEQEKYAPKNPLEQEISTELPKDKYKGYKDVKTQIEKLEDKNWAKTADKNSKFLDENGVNIFAPVYWLADAVTPNTMGMSDTEKVKYKELQKERRAIEMPIAKNRLERVQAQLDKMNSDRGAWNNKVDEYQNSDIPYLKKYLVRTILRMI